MKILKNSIICLAVIFIIFFVHIYKVRADFDQSSWRFFAKIVNMSTINKEMLFKVKLTGEMYDHLSGRSLCDLRVVLDKKDEVPFVIFIPDKKVEKVYQGEMFNLSHQKGKNTSFSLDFGDNPPSINSMEIKIASNNFRRRVTIEGSNDNKEWKIIRNNASIFDFSDDIKAAFTIVRFPQSKYRYLKLTIIDNAEEPLEILGASAFLTVPKEQELSEKVKVILNNQMEKKETNRSTELVLDMGFKNFPSDKLIFDIDNDHFWRRVVVKSSNNTVEWNSVAEAAIFNFSTDDLKREEVSISYPQTHARYIKVSIINNDDDPIFIKNIKVYAVPVYSYFNADKEGMYSLYFGNSSVDCPHYDFTKIFPHIDKNAAHELFISAIEQNSDYIKPQEPWLKRNRWVVYGAMGLAILILGVIALRLFKTL